MKRNRRKSSVGEVKVVAAREGDRVGNQIFNVRRDFRELMVTGGLAVMRALFEEDLAALCGPRYAHSEAQDSPAHRWGKQQGAVVLGGQKMRVERPRVRRGGKEVPLPSYDSLCYEDPLNERSLEQMVVGVSTRKYGRSVESVEPYAERFAVSKSAVSRRFVAKTQAQLETALSTSLADKPWAALLIDGIEFAEHVVVIALGVDSTGAKHVLGMRSGSTENASLCREMLSDIVARGVAADKSILVVIDGGKGLRKAVTQVFGQYGLVQRCQVHKRRNVLDQLPDDKRPQVRTVLEQAYSPTCSEIAAAKQLKKLAKVLEQQHPGASASLLEGLDETLTIKGLGLPDTLARSFATTNAIENMNGTIRRVSSRVKSWKSGNMVLRWVATGVLEAQSGFRRVRGHKSMPLLLEALTRRDDALHGDNVRQVG
jgi:putative transposase